MALPVIKMAASTRLPVVVVLGATGTGKSKLALEIGKCFKGEIISTDSMQVYKGLDIITNKVTPQEMEQCPHHMINYLSPLTENNTVSNFRDAAVPIINNLLKQKKLPVIVGGTNYYIEALLWNYLISSQDIEKVLKEGPTDRKIRKFSDPVRGTEKTSATEITQTNAGKPTTYDSAASPEPEIAVVPKEFECYMGTDTQALYNRLWEVDSDSARRLHPKDRRKIVRALEVYDTYGVPITDVYKAQRGSPGLDQSGRLRYKDICVFWVHSDKKVLNERTDKRVDSMIERGLLKELQGFHDEYNKSRIKTDGTADYTLGIFQSIGFKEFHEYLLMNQEDRETEEGRRLFQKGVDDMKRVTRQYARKQVMWIKNRFLKRGKEGMPPVYKLDSSDVSQWETNVNQPAVEILTDILHGRQPRHSPEPQEESSDVKVHNVCDICGGKVFVSLHTWNDHLKCRKHLKRKGKLKRLEQQKMSARSSQVECASDVKDNDVESFNSTEEDENVNADSPSTTNEEENVKTDVKADSPSTTDEEENVKTDFDYKKLTTDAEKL